MKAIFNICLWINHDQRRRKTIVASGFFRVNIEPLAVFAYFGLDPANSRSNNSHALKSLRLPFSSSTICDFIWKFCFNRRKLKHKTIFNGSRNVFRVASKKKREKNVSHHKKIVNEWIKISHWEQAISTSVRSFYAKKRNEENYTHTRK